MYQVIELAKNGIFTHGTFASKQEAQEEKENLISAFTHWDKPGCPCQKNFEVIESA